MCIGAGTVALVVGGDSKPAADADTAEPPPEPPPAPDPIAQRLAVVDERIGQGRLAGPQDDDALDHLLAIAARAPDDPRVTRRLTALADTFEGLANDAMATDSFEEAAVHLRHALQADPDRQSAAASLARAEEEIARRRDAGP